MVRVEQARRGCRTRREDVCKLLLPHWPCLSIALGPACVPRSTCPGSPARSHWRAALVPRPFLLARSRRALRLAPVRTLDCSGSTTRLWMTCFPIGLVALRIVDMLYSAIPRNPHLVQSHRASGPDIYRPICAVYNWHFGTKVYQYISGPLTPVKMTLLSANTDHQRSAQPPVSYTALRIYPQPFRTHTQAIHRPGLYSTYHEPLAVPPSALQ